MVLFVHFLPAQPGLKKAAGGTAGQVLADERIEGVHGKRLLSQQNVASGPVHHPPENLQILLQLGNVHKIAGGGKFMLPH